MVGGPCGESAKGLGSSSGRKLKVSEESSLPRGVGVAFVIRRVHCLASASGSRFKPLNDVGEPERL